MARFPHASEPVTAELAPLYADMVAAGFGGPSGPINFFKGMSLRPDLLAAGWGLCKAMLCEGQLPRTLTQLITMTISAQNDAPYCCATHTAALVALGVSRETIENCALDPQLHKVSEPNREILMFAKKVAAHPKQIDEADLDAMRRLGLSSEEILEVVLLAAFANWTNTWANAAAILVD